MPPEKMNPAAGGTADGALLFVKADDRAEDTATPSRLQARDLEAPDRTCGTCRFAEPCPPGLLIRTKHRPAGPGLLRVEAFVRVCGPWIEDGRSQLTNSWWSCPGWRARR
jgi:hypothetical protein